MAFNSSDRKSVVGTAKQNGWHVASNGTSMISSSGTKLNFSPSGGSVNINGTKYTDASSANKKLRK